MASIKFYLDVRRHKADGTCLLKLAISHQRVVRYVSLGLSINPDHWDLALCKVTAKNPMYKKINLILDRWKFQAGCVVAEWVTSGRSFSVTELQSAILAVLKPGEVELDEDAAERIHYLVPMFERFAAGKKESTRLTYERTLTHIKNFADGWEVLRFEDVTRSWLIGFDAHMAKSAPSANARAIHMRNLRAVFNFAIDEGATSWYPFRKFHIKTVATPKRSLSVEDLRSLFKAEVDPWQRPYLSFFKLSFCLIGINAIDLLSLTPASVNAGRVEFNRSKTSRLYSIKVEPEAAALIEELKGSGHLIRFLDERSDYLQFIRQTNHALKSIGTGSRPGRKGTAPALYPKLTTYWARHSWATVARSIGISIDDIALALGHGDGHDLTHIYLDEDLQKVDDANRRVLDWVFYSKR